MAYIGPAPNPGQNREVDDISSGFNGSEVNFTLQVNSQNVSPGSPNAIIVSLGGVVQNPGTDYTIAASTITFTTAPASGLSFFGLVLGQQVDTADANFNNPVITGDLSIADKIVHSGDTNTAIRFPAADTVSIETSGSEKIRVDSSGLIGIGTTSPDRTIHCHNSSNTTNVRAKFSNGTTGEGASDGFEIGINGSDPAQAVLVNNENSPMAFFTNATEAMRIDNSQRLLIGTSTEISNSGERTLQIQNTGGPKIALGRNDTSIVSGNTIGGIEFYGNDSDGAFKNCASIIVDADDSHSTNSKPTAMKFFVTENNDATSTERIRINDRGGLCVGNGVLGSNLADGNVLVDEGVYIGSFVGESQIRANSAGTGTNTLFIGNQSIQTSSDRRIKQNIVDTKIDASSQLKKVRVVDFTWNDPNDTATNNRNSRGEWTGCIAQEIVDVFPFAVNAPRPEGKEIDYDSEFLWGMEYGQLVPVLIKGFQELHAKITTLESEVAALKAA